MPSPRTRSQAATGTTPPTVTYPPLKQFIEYCSEGQLDVPVEWDELHLSNSQIKHLRPSLRRLGLLNNHDMPTAFLKANISKAPAELIVEAFARNYPALVTAIKQGAQPSHVEALLAEAVVAGHARARFRGCLFQALTRAGQNVESYRSPGGRPTHAAVNPKVTAPKRTPPSAGVASGEVPSAASATRLIELYARRMLDVLEKRLDEEPGLDVVMNAVERLIALAHRLESSPQTNQGHQPGQGI